MCNVCNTTNEKEKTMKATPKIIENHDYISVVFGSRGRLTKARYRDTSTGGVPGHVFDEFIRRTTLEPGSSKTYGEVIREFVADIDTIWPEWNQPVKKVAVGDRVQYDFGKKRGGVDTGTVVKVGRSAHVNFDRMGPFRMSFAQLEG